MNQEYPHRLASFSASVLGLRLFVVVLSVSPGGGESPVEALQWPALPVESSSTRARSLLSAWRTDSHGSCYVVWTCRSRAGSRAAGARSRRLLLLLSTTAVLPPSDRRIGTRWRRLARPGVHPNVTSHLCQHSTVTAGTLGWRRHEQGVRCRRRPRRGAHLGSLLRRRARGDREQVRQAR